MNSSVPNELLSSIVDDINAATKVITDPEGAKELARKRALNAARQLVASLESPAETVFQHAFSGPDRLCVRLAIRLRLFHLLAGKEGDPKNAAELASISGAEELFIVRIMRVLTAINFAREESEQSYAATAVTKAMTFPALEAAVTHTFDYNLQILTRMSAYFEMYGYRCPTEPMNGPFQYTFETKSGMFEYLEQDSQASKNFDTFMTASRLNRPLWTHWFPVQDEILNGFRNVHEKNNILIVDVGGGKGQDLKIFADKFPGAGRMILQDLPRTIAEFQPIEGVEPAEYDFFTPQPVRGARVYFFHYIMHNWPDHKVKEILSNTASAMTPGYSKLLLNEYILPEKGCPPSASYADLHMMAGLSALERTEKQFRELLESIGFKDVKCWYPPGSIEGIVEASLSDAPGNVSFVKELNGGASNEMAGDGSGVEVSDGGNSTLE